MVGQTLQTFPFPLRLTVAGADQRHDRRHVHQRQRLRRLPADHAGGHQFPKYFSMISGQPFQIAAGIQRGKLWRTKLLQRHHPAEPADLFIVKGIGKQLFYLAAQPFLRHFLKGGNILRRVLHMNVDPIGVLFILRRRRLHNGVEDRPLA
ncbi:MAG: hypothetical protein MR021_02030 [Clostridiales bacterium]|nr:hypothetical protein [Clostridiales bacterium]